MSRTPSPTEKQIETLGEARAMVIDCLGGNGRFTPVRFVSAGDAEFIPAYRAYVLELARLSPPDAQPITALLLAAGRLLLGELGEADRIIDGFPSEAQRLDHGAGYCNVAHLFALRSALPLPDHLLETTRWTAGSSKQAAMRAWLDANRAKLRWVESAGAYVTAG